MFCTDYTHTCSANPSNRYVIVLQLWLDIFLFQQFLCFQYKFFPRWRSTRSLRRSVYIFSFQFSVGFASFCTKKELAISFPQTMKMYAPPYRLRGFVSVLQKFCFYLFSFLRAHYENFRLWEKTEKSEREKDLRVNCEKVK